jgi:hypothetical protein
LAGRAEDIINSSMNTPMSPRLLSLLSLIEAAFGDRMPAVGNTRLADYRNGIARMTFTGGAGEIVLQNYLLADGQLCMRVLLRPAGQSVPAEVIETAIYPKQGFFDWSAEADRIVHLWLDRAPSIEPAELASA